MYVKSQIQSHSSKRHGLLGRERFIIRPLQNKINNQQNYLIEKKNTRRMSYLDKNPFNRPTPTFGAGGYSPSPAYQNSFYTNIQDYVYKQSNLDDLYAYKPSENFSAHSYKYSRASESPFINTQSPFATSKVAQQPLNWVQNSQAYSRQEGTSNSLAYNYSGSQPAAKNTYEQKKSEVYSSYSPRNGLFHVDKYEDRFRKSNFQTELQIQIGRSRENHNDDKYINGTQQQDIRQILKRNPFTRSGSIDKSQTYRVGGYPGVDKYDVQNSYNLSKEYTASNWDYLQNHNKEPLYREKSYSALQYQRTQQALTHNYLAISQVDAIPGFKGMTSDSKFPKNMIQGQINNQAHNKYGQEKMSNNFQDYKQEKPRNTFYEHCSKEKTREERKGTNAQKEFFIPNEDQFPFDKISNGSPKKDFRNPYEEFLNNSKVSKSSKSSSSPFQQNHSKSKNPFQRESGHFFAKYSSQKSSQRSEEAYEDSEVKKSVHLEDFEDIKRPVRSRGSFIDKQTQKNLERASQNYQQTDYGLEQFDQIRSRGSYSSHKSIKSDTLNNSKGNWLGGRSGGQNHFHFQFSGQQFSESESEGRNREQRHFRTKAHKQKQTSQETFKKAEIDREIPSKDFRSSMQAFKKKKYQQELVQLSIPQTSDISKNQKHQIQGLSDYSAPQIEKNPQIHSKKQRVTTEQIGIGTEDKQTKVFTADRQIGVGSEEEVKGVEREGNEIERMTVNDFQDIQLDEEEEDLSQEDDFYVYSQPQKVQIAIPQNNRESFKNVQHTTGVLREKKQFNFRKDEFETNSKQLKLFTSDQEQKQDGKVFPRQRGFQKFQESSSDQDPLPSFNVQNTPKLPQWDAANLPETENKLARHGQKRQSRKTSRTNIQQRVVQKLKLYQGESEEEQQGGSFKERNRFKELNEQPYIKQKKSPLTSNTSQVQHARSSNRTNNDKMREEESPKVRISYLGDQKKIYDEDEDFYTLESPKRKGSSGSQRESERTFIDEVNSENFKSSRARQQLQNQDLQETKKFGIQEEIIEQSFARKDIPVRDSGSFEPLNAIKKKQGTPQFKKGPQKKQKYCELLEFRGNIYERIQLLE